MIEFQDFIPKLKKHLLPRIKSKIFGQAEIPNQCIDDGIAAPNRDDWQSVLLKQDRIYRHNVMRVNYTTYDVRRSEDVVHVNTSHRHVMVLNSAFQKDETEHPFLYARVLGIFHANVAYIGSGNIDFHPRRAEFLWVRWLTPVRDSLSGWKSRRLDRVHFPPLVGGESFGFLDPADVLRACHLIPCFMEGKSHLGAVGSSHWAEDREDWHSYYINR